jgi:hypothetical protein
MHWGHRSIDRLLEAYAAGGKFDVVERLVKSSTKDSPAFSAAGLMKVITCYAKHKRRPSFLAELPPHLHGARQGLYQHAIRAFSSDWLWADSRGRTYPTSWRGV